MALDILIDDLTGDARFDIDGDIEAVTDELEVVRLAVQQAWRTQKGEWFLDTDFGVDYLGLVFVKAPDTKVAIPAELRRVALGVDNVDRVDNIVLTIDAITRKMTGSATIDTQFGSTDVSLESPEFG